MTASSEVFSKEHASRADSGKLRLRRTGLYWFCLGFAALDFVDMFDILDYSSASVPLKYCYLAVMVGFIFSFISRWRTIETDNIAAIIALLFFVITGFGFIVGLLFYDDRQGYVSAFIAALVYSLSVFIPRHKIIIDIEAVLKDLTTLFAIGAVLYLIEVLVKPTDLLSNLVTLHEAEFIKSIICVLALSLSILSGRKALAALLVVTTGIALFLRPTSTLVVALGCCLPLAFVLRLHVQRFRPFAVHFSRLTAFTVLAIAIATPILLYLYFDDIAEAINHAESFLKVDVLGGVSNTAFRLAVLKYAFTSFDQSSFWIGSTLRGSITVPIGQQYQWWYDFAESGSVTIHSDFVIILVLMGAAGYVVFSAMFYLILRDRLRELGRRNADRSSTILSSIAIIAVLALLIYSSTEPYLTYYNHVHVVWMLLLIAEIARKSRYQVKRPLMAPTL